MAKASRPGRTAWFAFFPSDFLASTQTMTDAEAGAYIRALCVLWDRGPCSRERLEIAVPGLYAAWDEIEPHLTEVEPGTWTQLRLEEERLRALDKAEHAREAARGRWAKVRKGMQTHMQTHMQPQCFSDSDSDSEPDTDPERKSCAAPAPPTRKRRRVSGEHSEAIDHWCTAYEASRGEPYPFEPIDARQIQNLRRRKDWSLGAFKLRVGVLLADPFWAENGLDLKVLVSQWTRLGDPAKNKAAREEAALYELNRKLHADLDAKLAAGRKGPRRLEDKNGHAIA